MPSELHPQPPLTYKTLGLSHVGAQLKGQWHATSEVPTTDGRESLRLRVLIIVHPSPEESHLSDCFPFCLSCKTKLHLVEKSTLPHNSIDEIVILQIIIVWKGRSRIWPQESKCSEAGGYNPLVPEVGEGTADGSPGKP